MAHSSAGVGVQHATANQCEQVIQSLVPEADARWSSLMKGVIYPDPPSADQVKDPALELSIEDLQGKIDRGEFENLPMLIEHDPDATHETRVGRIVRATINPNNRNVEIEFRLREDAQGNDTVERVRSGQLSELSLGHVYMNETGKSRALEVSLVAKGARSGCKIIRASARLGTAPAQEAPPAAAATAADAAAAAPVDTAAPAAPTVAPVVPPAPPAPEPTSAPMEAVVATDDVASAAAAKPSEPVITPAPPNAPPSSTAPAALVATPPVPMDSTATSSAQAAPVAPVAAAAAPAPVDAAQALQQQQLTVVRDTTGRFVSPPAATDSTSGQKRSAHDASLESTQDAKRAEPERGGATSAAAAAAAAAAPPMTADMIMAMSKFGNEMIEREQARARAAAAAAATPTPVPQQQQQQAPAAAAAAPVASQQTVMSEEDKRRYEELRQWAAEKAAADAAVAAEGLQRMQSVLTAQAASGAQGDAARQLAEWMKNDTFIKSRQGQEMLMRAARLSTTTTPQTVMVTASAGAPPQQQQQAPVQQQQPQQVPTGYFSQASMGTMVHASAAQRPAAEPVSAAPLSEYKQVLNEYIRRSVVEEAAGFERAMRMAGVPIEYAAFGAPTGPVPQGGMRINASAAATEKRVHPLHEIIAQGFRNMHERFKGMEMTSTRVRRIGYDRDGQPILGV